MNLDSHIFKNNELPISNICFIAGTLIKTDQGTIPIENIIPSKNTINNKNITFITQTITYDDYLVCFEKNALGKYPDRKTIMSKDHKIMYENKMTEAYKFLKHFKNVNKVKYNQEILYNVLMETHEKIKANNLICESLNPKNIIAKIYSLDKEYKKRIIIIMNHAIKKKDYKTYKKIIKRLS